jgi:predicted phosphate transport protein (TIGR00153 family)
VRLIPRDNSFYDMFSKMSENLTHGAEVLVALFAEYHTAEEKVKEIRRIENVGDEMMHNILKKLNQTFITPFDREDIHRLASSIDDVLDLIKAAGDRVILYNITQAPSAAGQLAHLILRQTEELGKAVSSLQKNGQVLSHCVEINRLENEADEVSQTAIGYLFDTEIDPINLIRIKELMEVLERATDKAEDAADVLESVVLKNT